MANDPALSTAEDILQDRYRVAEVIGRGGMATVYRGTDLVLDREVALKIFRPDAADAEQRARQQGEVRLLARLNHHGLVTLYDAGAAVRGGEPVSFLVMELVPGSDLRRRLATGPLPGPEAARIGAGLAEALRYIHHHGVVHRDVKPANILLAQYAGDAQPRPKLADFGIARLQDGAGVTATNTLVGTAGYLSPEQVSGAGADYPSDIYSLGLVLLESLTGKVEYPGAALTAAVARLSREPEIPAALGPRWRELLAAMTAKDPAERPSAGEAARMLQEMTGHEESPPAAGQAVPGPAATAGITVPRPPAGTMLPVLDPGAMTNATQSWRPPSVPPPPSQGPSAPPAGPIRPVRGRRPGRRALWALAAAVVLITGALILNTTALAGRQSAGVEPAPSPTPTVTGDLGQHLRELEESVTP